MNTRQPQDDPREPAEERDALLTALALGQLSGDELVDVQGLLSDPAAGAERRVVDETRAVADALRAARRVAGTTPSTGLRRAVVAALARADDRSPEPVASRSGTGTPARASPSARYGWLTLSGALAASALVGLAVTRQSSPLVRDPIAFSPVVSPVADAPASGPVAVDGLSRLDGPPKPQAAADKRLTPHAPETTSRGVRDEKVSDSKRMAASAAPTRREAAGAEPRGLAANGSPSRTTDTAEKPFLFRRRVDADRVAANEPGGGGRVDQRAKSADEGDRAVPADVSGGPRALTERYATFAENGFRRAADAPLSTFSIDVDTASYALVRRFLASGRLPPPDAVRIEELLNYFSYDDPVPAGEDPFSVTVEAAMCPWRPGHRLVRIGLEGRNVPRDERPAGNLVFLVDVSGSMRDDDKLPLVKQGLAMLVEELTENDRVAIVTYAGDAGLRLPSTNGDDKGTILAAIGSLTSGGGTHGSAGIELAYAQAAEHFVPGGVNRVILATDGDLNVGITDDSALVELITAKAADGTFLTVLGVGQGNLQDEKLEKLAAHGNGVYAYLDGAREARKVLVEQLTGSTITIAKDVKIQVEFNPVVVGSWRQIGYENRAMAARDFRDDAKDAGDIGAGHAVTALYEVALVDEADDQSGGEPLRYGPQPEGVERPVAKASAELLTVKLRFKRPDGDTSQLREVPLAGRGGAFAVASADLRFAASVAAFGMLLRKSEHAGDATFGWVVATAAKALGRDPGGWRAEFLDLVRRAESIR